MVAKYPAIPEPTIDPASLRDAVLSLKQAFEILTGQRGNPDYAAWIGPVPDQVAAVTSLPAISISVTPAGNIASVNVQAALVELDTEKLSTTAASSTYVELAGDTMTGHLSLPITPAAANAVRKDYVDTADALKVAKAGDTMTGHLSLPITPAAANAVRRDYVDAADLTLTNAVAKLTNNQFARVCRITSNQSFTTSVLNKVQFNSVNFDPSGIWDATNFRFKPTVAGYYRHSWNIYMGASSAGTSYACSAKNGGRSALGTFGSSSVEQASGGSDIIHLDGTTEYVEVQVIHTGTSPFLYFSTAGDFAYSSIELVKAD